MFERKDRTLYPVFNGIVGLYGKIDVRAFEQTGYEIGIAMKRTGSKLATAGTGSGRCLGRRRGDEGWRVTLRGGAMGAAEDGRPRRLAPVGEPLAAKNACGGRKPKDESFPGTGTVPGRSGWTEGRRTCRANGYPTRDCIAREKPGGACNYADASSVARRGEPGPPSRLPPAAHSMWRT